MQNSLYSVLLLCNLLNAVCCTCKAHIKIKFKVASFTRPFYALLLPMELPLLIRGFTVIQEVGKTLLGQLYGADISRIFLKALDRNP